VVLTSWGSRGDVEPLAGLAVQLRELGAEVRVCAPPDEDFVALLARAGVEHVPLGPSVRSVAAGTRAPTQEDAFRLAAELVAARFETLGTAAEGSDALVATGLLPAGAPDVAELLGLRYVLARFQIYGTPSRHFAPGRRPGTPSPEGETDLDVLWKQDAERVNALYGPALNSHRTALGLKQVDNVRDHVSGGENWLAADPLLVPWEKGRTHLDLVQTGAWILPDERTLPDGLEEFLDTGAPPVYVGFGSAGLHANPDLGRIAVEAIRAHGRRVVLARGWAGLDLTDDRDDCFVVGEVNQQALFPRMAAVVHHGGAGTTTTAAVAGAPQLVVPQFADQPTWAARVASLGIGAAHDGPTPTVDSLSAALATALSPETLTRARAVAPTIGTDGASVAARMLLDAA
jgi:vancomycin aglycone glucosyltransferase